MEPTSSTEIRTRRDFHSILMETLTLAKQLRASFPTFPPFQNVVRQLDAMAAWTANDRVPSDDERSSIDVALVAVRDLESDPDPKVQALCNRLFALSAFFDNFT
jgi:hypothetical protein